MKKVWKLILIALIAVIILVFMLVKKDDDYGEKKESVSLTIQERIWIPDQEKTIEYTIESAKSGDMIFNLAGYKLYISEIYDKAVILTQDGGLMPEHENGSFNALSAPDDFYVVWYGNTLRLRSYSLNSGVSLKININEIK